MAGLRLLIVADSTTTHTHRWAHWARDCGAKVTVLSPFEGAIEGVDVVVFPGRRRFYHRLPKIKMLLDLPRFRRLIERINPQLIHFHFISEGGRAFYWDRFDIPMIASSWGQDVIFDTGPRPKAEKGLRRILSRCRIVTATTHMLAGATAPYMPPGRPIYVIPFGVDLARFPMRQSPSGDEVVFGFVKHLLPKYGPDILIEAFAQVHTARPRTRLVMAGRGHMHDHLQKRVDDLHLTHAVSIVGRVEHEKVPELIRGFDVMVMPSIYESETFGVAAIEASASGVANIASRIGGVPEAVIHGKTGLLVPPRDAATLAVAMIELADDPTRRAEMGRQGRRFVEAFYVWQDNCRMMQEVYRAALANESPRDLTVWNRGQSPDFAW